jgi:FlaA1/EpsC-like NDP-sugar epimerase
MPNDPEVGPRDIPVKFVGSRPGEKLHEVLWDANEAVGDTVHPKIMRLSRPPIDEAWLHDQLQELARLADEGDTLEVVAKLGSIVREPKREALLHPEPSGASGPLPTPLPTQAQ